MSENLDLDTIKDRIRSDVVEFAESSLDADTHFVCIYGSLPTSHFRHESDLDIFFAAESPCDGQFEAIQSFVIAEHNKFGLELDQEVPYKNKLLVTYDDFEQAASLDVFGQREDGTYIVPQITDDTEFLGSLNARKRLLLNAMTTPHDFLYGNQQVYTALRTECEKAALRLACGIGSIAVNDDNNVMNILLSRGSDGESGRAYLGYKQERQEVVSHLEALITRNHDYLETILADGRTQTQTD